MIHAKNYKVTLTFEVLVLDPMKTPDVESQLDEVEITLDNGTVRNLSISYESRDVSLDVNQSQVSLSQG
jgi:hypothetical protein